MATGQLFLAIYLMKGFLPRLLFQLLHDRTYAWNGTNACMNSLPGMLRTIFHWPGYCSGFCKYARHNFLAVVLSGFLRYPYHHITSF